MKIRPLLYNLTAASLLILFLAVTAFKSEEDPLQKRLFNVSLSEIKEGLPAKKVISDKMLFKNGHLKSDFLYSKYGYKWLRYRINKDSIYTDSTDTEVRFLEVEAIYTDKKNQTIFVNFTTCEWDIDGSIKITKNDKVKKYYSLFGREKGGKPKKAKKKRNETPILEILK